MDTRGYCQDRLESRGSGDVQPTQRPPPVPHPRRCGVQAAIPPSHHRHDLQHWPLHDTLTLGALADAVPLARAHLRQLLSGWGRAELSPDAGVVVSELVTNAVAASRERRLAAAPVLVWLGSQLLPSPRRGGREPPATGTAEPGARRRRGPGAGPGGSAQQPVGMAPGQHHRAEESCLGGMVPAIRDDLRPATGLPDRRAPFNAPCRGGDSAGSIRAWSQPQP